ncbi:hypothetical protein NYZ99_06345 [Maribacter litopenaei]|uniref:Uncharacterized protein n=1 Tax=Maribacter litopenaei TaxID=2976127 RepID=A0ABY5YCM1_9FLAO|nr:hypothetical protein [Maribacter litopenaei]UWX55964.1 hypothetical protein NYZ99_06345 [Maribacter litopenaei]
MSLKQKALLFNFLGFAAIFLVMRFGLPYFLSIKPLYISLFSALLAMVLAPKFAIAQVEGTKKLMMKWIFLKGFKEL